MDLRYTFNDPQEALSKYEPGLYDLVMLDIKTPRWMVSNYITK
jgi:CheY-like chemotaxis protein